MSELGLSVTSIKGSVNCLGNLAGSIEFVPFPKPETEHHKAHQREQRPDVHQVALTLDWAGE